MAQMAKNEKKQAKKAGDKGAPETPLAKESESASDGGKSKKVASTKKKKAPLFPIKPANKKTNKAGEPD